MSSTQEPTWGTGRSLFALPYGLKFHLGPTTAPRSCARRAERLDLDALAVEAVQLWLVVERVHVRRPAITQTGR